MPRITLMTPYEAHVRRWRDCTLCPLSSSRSRVVLARGTVPADVVFVGEAPWKGEDDVGEPFVGKAGHELDVWIARGIAMAGVQTPRIAFTNLIGCIPLADAGDPTSNRNTKAPPKESIDACRPRLEEFLLEVASPKVVVAVGVHARDWLEPGIVGSAKIPPGTVLSHIVHPGWALRQVVVHQTNIRQRSAVAIRDALLRASDPSDPGDGPPAF